MKKLVFATNNEHKKLEIASLLPDYTLLNLKDIGCLVDIPETGTSFAENAALKSNYVFTHFGFDCFADDSGLEVAALNQAPGIFSARYSGVKDDLINLQLLLKNMEGQTNRQAQFKTVISLIHHGNNYLFEGIIKGTIRETPSGTNGFGYDPIFQPDGYEVTFAEMSLSEKNKISHRALAMQQLLAFLTEK